MSFAYSIGNQIKVVKADVPVLESNLLHVNISPSRQTISLLTSLPSCMILFGFFCFPKTMMTAAATIAETTNDNKSQLIQMNYDLSDNKYTENLPYRHRESPGHSIADDRGIHFLTEVCCPQAVATENSPSLPLIPRKGSDDGSNLGVVLHGNKGFGTSAGYM